MSARVAVGILSTFIPDSLTRRFTSPIGPRLRANKSDILVKSRRLVDSVSNSQWEFL
jgi:hypothetical protein